MARIFISYSRKDEVFARRLAADLDRLGADVWIDVDDIPAGTKWGTAIQLGLDTCEVMIVIISPHSMASVNVEDEWQYYLDQHKPLMPVLWLPAKVHFQLSRIQYINFHTQDYDTAFVQLHAELNRKGIRLAPLPSGGISVLIPVQPPLPVRRKPFPRSYLTVGLLAVVGIVAAIAVLLNGFLGDGDDNKPTSTSPVVVGQSSKTPVSTIPTEQVLPETQVYLDLTATEPPLDPLAAALERAQDFSGTNADWEPFVQTFDGVEMVLVPAGCFTMGSTDEQTDYIVSLEMSRESISDEQPAHEVCFDEPFWIDRTEVTNAQFTTFNGEAANPSNFTGDNLPRENITWFEASDFCENREMRLPTEAEWEYAARGPDGLIYPWGNEWNAEKVIGGQYGSEGTVAVGTKPEGASWVGVLDLSGNVWEWVADWYGTYSTGGQVNPPGPASGDYRVLRGGSWEDNKANNFRAAFRCNWDAPDCRDFDWGFRCARPATSALSTPITSLPASSTATPIPAGSPNIAWTPVIQDLDGVAMVYVPAGCFMMGSSNPDDNAKPVHEVCFDQPFWIDKMEVTNAQFTTFGGQAASSSYWTWDNRPRENIAWSEADSFCESRGARLPTEAEWEYAARGPESWVYPWGNEFIADNVVYSGNSNQTSDVGSKPDGASWVGALDMSGNVWEWTVDWCETYPTERQVNPTCSTNGKYRTVRGGSWRYDIDRARTANRFGNAPDVRINLVGFRCVRSEAG